MAVYQCPECGYRYDEDRGDPEEGYGAGTPFSALPATFACPDCSVRYRDDFEQQAADQR